MIEKLEFNKKRNTAELCPCGKSNKDGKFAPYIGFENCGYCHSCGETFLPTIEKEQTNTRKPPPPKIDNPISFVSLESLKASLNNYEQNNFVQFLKSKFGNEITQGLISRYFLGTSKHWSGANVFWQIDQSNKIRTGKIMQYNATDGKRIKEPNNLIHWVHKAIEQPNFNLNQCFFGEHLLKDKTKTVAIVESEKTAIISSVYFPKFIWLAVGSKTNLSLNRMKILQGRKIVLFPDLNCFELWQTKANEFKSIGQINVSDLLERMATSNEKEQGLDLADYLLKFEDARTIEKISTTPIIQQVQAPPDTIQKGKLFYRYELKEKVNLNDSTVDAYCLA